MFTSSLSDIFILFERPVLAQNAIGTTRFDYLINIIGHVAFLNSVALSLSDINQSVMLSS